MNHGVKRAASVITWLIVPVLQPWGFVLGQQAGGAAADPTRPIYRAMLCSDRNGRLTITHAPREVPPGEECRSLGLPVPPSSVRWAFALAAATPPGPDSLVLSGTGQDADFAPTAASFAEKPGLPERPGPLPLEQSLIPGLSARVFGIEERAVFVRTDSEITMQCRPGARAAGLVLDPGRARLPDGAALVLRWHVTGDPGFSAAHASVDSDEQSIPVPSDGILDQAPSRSAAAWEAPRFVLSCPAGAGSLTLHDLRLAPQPSPRMPAQAARSAWAWRSQRWRETPERLVAEALALETRRLFVSVEIEDGTIREEARFSDFVRLAGASGIAVAVVEGDPGMALEEGRAEAIRRLGALAAYQRRSAGDRQLAGVQYDIEPYLLPGFRTDPDHILRGWAATLDGLSAAAPPLALDLVLPFWLPRHGASDLVLPMVRRVAERVTVMAYRTTPSEILAAAEPMLAWSTTAGRPLHVALEAGPVGDETTRTYRRAESGDLLLVTEPGGGGVALLLARPIALPASDRLYSLQRETIFPGSRVSFLADQRRLEEALTQVSARFSAWPSFSGIALHGLID
ncbi:hypothetical protein MKK63_29575 [Methylobacterium sp. J-088]|uniref:hypothetical protein n=1 Tax=Methylobacterium sp. J-088 TaxID=2836664 RepID=UPI001FB97859|nr:hypothetical protein [Methylobacterium sp. J-088]MCJ2066808.1 hypothetical protein [Methylobacterium sp. J-088]